MIISEKIFERLDEINMTQKAFSEKTGISQSTISDWKHKKTNPSADKIMVICDALGMSPEELLTTGSFEGEYIVIDKESDEYIFLENFRRMSQGDKERLKYYMEKL